MGETVHCIVHHEARDVGLVGEWLGAHGMAVEVCQPNAGGALPPSESVSRAIVFGGAMSANDVDDPAIAGERAWIEKLLARDVPMIGICLGAQLIAGVHGAAVVPHGEGLWEIGYRDVSATEEGAAMFDGGERFFQWHQEGFALPAGATRLATGALYPEQAYRIGARVFGFQFHPEVSAGQLRRWHRTLAHEMVRPGADDLETQRSDDMRHRPGVERWLDRFLSHWVTL